LILQPQKGSLPGLSNFLNKNADFSKSVFKSGQHDAPAFHRQRFNLTNPSHRDIMEK